MSKKTFIVEVDYPDCDTIPDEEFVETIGDWFDANIMDGDKGRLHTNVTVANMIDISAESTEHKNFVASVSIMREKQNQYEDLVNDIIWNSVHTLSESASILDIRKSKNAAELKIDQYLEAKGL